MQQPIDSQHMRDGENRPAGGVTTSVGLHIVWQNGPLQIGNERREPNGCFVETVIAAAIDRLQHYQQSMFISEYNAQAISHLQEAMAALEARTADREFRHVEGTHQL